MVEVTLASRARYRAKLGHIPEIAAALRRETGPRELLAMFTRDDDRTDLKKAGKWIAGTAVVGGAALWKLGQAGASFEEAITAVGAVGLQTRDQIADLEKEALRLGSTTQFTATQAANAMEIMARAGFSNAEIMSGVGGVLDAAAASGLGMAEVANHVSNVMKGMGLEAAEAGRVADVLTVASSATNSSIGSLGESMKNLSPVAKQFGVSLEDAVGMVALLQDVGLDASEAASRARPPERPAHRHRASGRRRLRPGRGADGLRPERHA